jgi:hypothetical protein
MRSVWREVLVKASLRSPRAPSRLSDSFHHQLNNYALAATTAGVSLLALSQPSEAKIVYIKTYQVIRMNGVYPLSFNHDGIIDFLIEQTSANFDSLLAQAAYGNALGGKKTFAAALKKGSVIGPGRSFTSGVAWAAKMAYYACTEAGSCRWYGQWGNVTHRYLGLSFRIKGETHYGWARLSTQTGEGRITTTLTGYAYETIANKAIRAGQTSGDASPETPSAGLTGWLPNQPDSVAKRVWQTTQPLSLGKLALGTAGAPSWGRP